MCIYKYRERERDRERHRERERDKDKTTQVRGPVCHALLLTAGCCVVLQAPS